MPSSYASSLDKDGLKGARIGVLRSFFGQKPEHAVVNRVVGASIETMRGQGAELVELDIPLDVDQLIKTMDVQKWGSKTQIDAWLRGLGPGAPAIHTFDDWVASGKFAKTLEKGLREAQPFAHPDSRPAHQQPIRPRPDALPMPRLH